MSDLEPQDDPTTFGFEEVRLPERMVARLVEVEAQGRTHHTARGGDADREARIEALAEDLHIRREHLARGDGRWRPWAEISDQTKAPLRNEATILDDLGYRNRNARQVGDTAVHDRNPLRQDDSE